MSEEDCRQFNIIYESLLLEGRSGNLTKSTLEVVLAQKPPIWLQVMYERLKHLIISSETFRNRIKMGYGLRIETKLDGKSRLLGNEGQEGFQTMSSSHSWPKDKSTKNSTIGIIYDQFCWQIGVVIVEFWLVYSILNSSQIERIEFDKKREIKQGPSSVTRDGKKSKSDKRESSERKAREADDKKLAAMKKLREENQKEPKE